MLTIHGRTRKEMSKVPVHWEEVGRICVLRDQIAPQTLLVGNGDIRSRQEGIELAARYGLDGLMIGRGIFQDPFVFSSSSPWERYTPDQRLELFAAHVRLFMDTWRHHERALPQLYKFCKVYCNGFDGAKELRERIMLAPDAAALLGIITEATDKV